MPRQVVQSKSPTPSLPPSQVAIGKRKLERRREDMQSDEENTKLLMCVFLNYGYVDMSSPLPSLSPPEGAEEGLAKAR